uniref:Uncharacterized protein n=1 Tax=Timema cristinae TaxID=61476 RepID=A0A7R9D961_TIMCR|nr:unnamed protein product [Timema cristinae]
MAHRIPLRQAEGRRCFIYSAANYDYRLRVARWEHGVGCESLQQGLIPLQRPNVINHVFSPGGLYRPQGARTLDCRLNHHVSVSLYYPRINARETIQAVLQYHPPVYEKDTNIFVWNCALHSASDAVFDCCAHAHIGGVWGGRWDCQVERALLLSHCRLWRDAHSSQLTADDFEKLPDQIMYPYAEQYDLQKHVFSSSQQSSVSCQSAQKKPWGYCI